MDREKVIKGMRMCISPDECSPDECPYYIRPNNESGLCWDRLMTDALAMLNEQGEQIKKRDESLEKAYEEIKWLRGMMKEQEAVVRCKDCKNFRPENYVAPCKKVMRSEDADENWFCADGEHKSWENHLHCQMEPMLLNAEVIYVMHQIGTVRIVNARKGGDEMDREKVIKGLECHHDNNHITNCADCPYFVDDGCVNELHDDALALIDTQYKLILELQNLISIGTKMMNGGEVE